MIFSLDYKKNSPLSVLCVCVVSAWFCVQSPSAQVGQEGWGQGPTRQLRPLLRRRGRRGQRQVNRLPIGLRLRRASVVQRPAELRPELTVAHLKVRTCGSGYGMRHTRA